MVFAERTHHYINRNILLAFAKTHATAIQRQLAHTAERCDPLNTNIMNIEKVKNYNQKMLATLSTILVIMAAIGLISLIVYLIAEIIPDKKPKTNTLLADEKVEQLKKDSLRQQIISYDNPLLIDTINLVYLIPVNVKTLGKPEDLDSEIMGLMDIRPGKAFGSSERYFEEYFYGSFNNLLIYDYKNSITQKICDRRIIGTDLSYNYFLDDIMISFSGAESDTDKDGIITLKDMRSLYIYALKEKRLRHISIKNSTVLSFEHIKPYKDLLITFGYDRNKDDLFEGNTEPRFIMKYDFQSDSLFPIVEKKLEMEIQKLIDKN
jgi:hypothetical protein